MKDSWTEEPMPAVFTLAQLLEDHGSQVVLKALRVACCMAAKHDGPEAHWYKAAVALGRAVEEVSYAEAMHQDATLDLSMSVLAADILVRS